MCCMTSRDYVYCVQTVAASVAIDACTNEHGRSCDIKASDGGNVQRIRRRIFNVSIQLSSEDYGRKIGRGWWWGWRGRRRVVGKDGERGNESMPHPQERRQIMFARSFRELFLPLPLRCTFPCPRRDEDHADLCRCMR